MVVIERWTGRHARALQAALRMTNEAFAEYLGVAVRTVGRWREQPEMVPSTQLQQALDTALELSSDAVRWRFRSAVTGAAPTADASAPAVCCDHCGHRLSASLSLDPWIRGSREQVLGGVHREAEEELDVEHRATTRTKRGARRVPRSAAGIHGSKLS